MTDTTDRAAGCTRPPMTHQLKCWPEYFQAIIDGRKTFEVRKADRDFNVGDTLHLREFVPQDRLGGQAEHYTGRAVDLEVTHILGERSPFGFDGFVVMGFRRAPAPQPSAEADAARVERVARVLCEAFGAGTLESQPAMWVRIFHNMARAALAEMRGGEDTEVANAVAHMAAHDRDEALVRAMEAEKQLSDLTALLSQVRSELDAMTRDRDGARRRLVELERAEEVRDAVCEERNMLAKRIGELEAALTETCALVSAEYCSHAGDCGPDNRACYVREALAVLGKRGGGTVNTAEGEARMAAQVEVVKRQQDEERCDEG